MDNTNIFDKHKDQARSSYVSRSKVPISRPEDVLAKDALRGKLNLPNLGELDVIRHFSRLASLNFSVDSNFYPLGSCTMKYNPKINEELAKLEGFSEIHPLQPEEDIQGALEIMYNLEQALSEITGMKRFSFQSASGAQGELGGLLMIRKFLELNNKRKTKVIVPDSAHGTNPASVAMAGFKTQVVESNDQGLIDIDKLSSLVDDDTAALMLTNPNTLGLFEEDIFKISQIIHSRGGLLYYDGANFNPLLGITKPSLMGFDIIHLNLHKTFSTPHGCGGPGSGVVGVTELLEDFLPQPLVAKKDDKFFFDYQIKHSIGRLRSFYGNFSVLVRAYAYILRLGQNGLLRVAQNSILNANYVKEGLKDNYQPAYPKRCLHEVVFSCQKQKERGSSALDIAKRLIDFGIHPPTMYFPLIVKEALMVEPTETESKDTLDYFIKAMITIDKEIDEYLERNKTSPHSTPVKRVDEVKAARHPDLKWENPGD